MTKVEQVALAIWQSRMKTTDGYDYFYRLDSKQDWLDCAEAAIKAMGLPIPDHELYPPMKDDEPDEPEAMKTNYWLVGTSIVAFIAATAVMYMRFNGKL